jgi:phosphoglycerate dehydrogenase-like enzyme
MSAEQVAGLQGVVCLAPRVTTQTLARSDDFLAVGRFGVGYDNVDVAACTAAGVVLTIARGAVDWSVAEAIVGWMISLAHHVRSKDRLVREARWDDRTHYMGGELRERTLGVIGCGGIGKALLKMVAGFRMNPPLIFDPYLDDAAATSCGARKVDLATLMSQADFISINCPLTPETRDLVGRRELALMKPTAWLINTARGGIVNEDALFEALTERRIAGAALDCFDNEPLTAPSRFAPFENVLLAPHSIAWTHELFRDIGQMVAQSLIDLAHGRRPHGIINAEVFDQPKFQEKWRRLQLAG